jgi:hypothetical protein
VASRILTRDQAQSRKDKAVRFAENVLDEPDLADDIESEDLDSWVERKGIKLIDNPRERILKMANGNGGSDITKADLQDCVDEATSILEDAYTPEASREELAAAIGQALDILSGSEEDDEQDEDDQGDDDDRG